MDKKRKRILIIRLSALGDVAMTVPAIYSLAKQYPMLDIDVLTRPFFGRLFINKPENVNIIAADFKGEYKGARGTLRLLRKLGQLRPDCVADLHNVLRSWIIDSYFRLRGTRVEMVDKMRSDRGELFKTGRAQQPFVERYADVFKRLGYPITLDFKSLYEDKQGEAPVCVEHPAIGIAPFARYYNKTYPAESMLQLIDMLIAEGYNVYLFGGRGEEAEKLKNWTKGKTKCHSLAGKYPLEEEIMLMSTMDAMISMDSSNQHMASLAGTPVISIWGSTTPACGFMGYRQDGENAVYLGLECQPCSVGGAPECPKGHFDCMRKLFPEIIAEKVKKLVPKK